MRFAISTQDGRRSSHAIFFILTSLLALVLVLSPPRIASGKDTLGDFEDAVRDSEGSDSGDDNYGGYDDDDSDLLDVVFASMIGQSLKQYGHREAGAPAAALLRLEGSYQRLNSADVDGYTLRGDLVWEFFGIGGEFIRYREDSPSQNFDFTTIEGLFRFVPHEALRLTLAAGSRRLEGKRKTTAFEGGLSFGAYPIDWLGVEIDLRWADLGNATLGDYRIGGLLRHPDFPFIALRGGYRNIQIQGESLHGGEIGAVVTW